MDDGPPPLDGALAAARARRILHAADGRGALLFGAGVDLEPNGPRRESWPLTAGDLVAEPGAAPRARCRVLSVDVAPDGAPVLRRAGAPRPSEAAALDLLEARVAEVARLDASFPRDSDGAARLPWPRVVTPREEADARAFAKGIDSLDSTDAAGRRVHRLVVTPDDLRAMLGRPTREPLDPARAADLRTLAYAVAQPEWRDGAPTGEALRGAAGAEALLAGFGGGAHRSLRLDWDRIEDMDVVGGRHSEALFARLGEVNVPRAAEQAEAAAERARQARAAARERAKRDLGLG